MKTLSRAEYETICAAKNIQTLPMSGWTEEQVWGKWSASAAYSSDPARQEANAIHASRQAGYFAEKTAAPSETPAPVATTESATVEMKKCSCGHTIPKHLVMSASLGSSCPDCYDKMSDEIGGHK